MPHSVSKTYFPLTVMRQMCVLFNYNRKKLAL